MEISIIEFNFAFLCQELCHNMNKKVDLSSMTYKSGKNCEIMKNKSMKACFLMF